MPTAVTPLVAVIMGSTSDWETMSAAVAMLERFAIPYEKAAWSRRNRTPAVDGRVCVDGAVTVACR
jgi:5-(carboxyamino)imidazole ribonucleotide mutase